VKNFVSQINFQGMSFFLLDDYKLKQLSFFAGKDLVRTPARVSTKSYKIFGIIPAFGIIQKNNKSIYTCLLLPILSIKNKKEYKKISLFNVLPLLTIKTKETA